jgi:hypothetical protein
MASPLGTLVTDLRKQGVETVNGGSHLKLMYRSRLVGVLPRNLQIDNQTAYRKTCAQLRRYGLTVSR